DLQDEYAPHFHRHDRHLCVWAFDHLHHNGHDLRELPLFDRMPRLKKLILTTYGKWLSYSESFDLSMLMARLRLSRSQSLRCHLFEQSPPVLLASTFDLEANPAERHDGWILQTRLALERRPAPARSGACWRRAGQSRCPWVRGYREVKDSTPGYV